MLNLLSAAAGFLLLSCDSIVDDRIPAYPVAINLGDTGLWNTYGVAGFGIYRNFIKDATPSSPSGFAYTATSYTGFGGVLLIGGMDPYSGNTNVPLAYDLACPVEVKPDVRVRIDPETFNAVCPVCGSVYDVTMSAGAPLSGPAAAPNMKYRLQNYSVLGTQLGGYIITR
ncbi:MAG: hypothetical protein HDS70_05765 [Bacteroidales bacterium]|nr:hypothetical protein [Bacteroidales bacterium]MBD5212458.1 hypothetical protein [Bacteroidales bacterium]MBD5213130.1 hypothetical protein [Bacteroidales bacterium]MBD5217563.1 hypothetical protein [Bacteroidales bacterium]MBD5221859.1 hypothetical protein [Bacteroidales bacterium]